jgi:hypothetical protein
MALAVRPRFNAIRRILRRFRRQTRMNKKINV